MPAPTHSPVRSPWWRLGALLTLFALPLSGTAAPGVVATIQPIHSLVAGVMEGIGEPSLLIHGNESPHTFSLRPSDARQLHAAKLVVWVDEGLETPLAHTLESLDDGVRVLTLSAVEGMELLPVREGGAWEAHDHGDGEHQAEEHAVGDEEAEHHHHRDLHLWLSPRNAGRVVRATLEALSDLDPANAERYRANAQRQLQRLRDLDRRLAERTAPVRERPYIVFHDAYQLFEKRYHLNAVGSVTLSPERAPGARRVHQLRGKIRDLGVRCVFAEPQFEPKLVRTLIEGSGARAGVLDPLGATLPAGPDAYFRLMNALADSLVGCLGE
ncbi:zinc ABC transporter substrate-binding protein [Endothiovibrio diazotrophicus]